MYTIFKYILLTCLLWAKVLTLTAQILPQDSKLIKDKLKNGFSYYIYPATDESTQSVIQLFVRAGSLQEKEDQRGLAHFVEHMAFNGSKNYPKNEVVSFLESLGVKFGADLNAYTSYDQTVYKITVNTENYQNLLEAIDIVADWAFELTFDSLEIEKERGVIVEEWRTKQGASARLSEQYLPLVFYNSRFAARQPIGTLDVLTNFRHHTIKQFYKDWYRPNLMGLAIVTNQNTQEVEKYIRKLFGKAKNPKKAPTRETHTIPPHQDSLFFIATDAEENDVDFSFLTKTKALRNINTEAILREQVLHSFFNSLSKKRFDRIRQKNAQFKSATYSASNLLAEEAIVVGGASLYENHIADGIKHYLYELARMRKYGFTQAEIEAHRTAYLAQISRANKNSDDPNPTSMIELIKADFYEGNTVMDRRERNRLLQKLQQDIDSVTLSKFIRSLYIEGNTVVMLTGPDRVKEFLPNKTQIQHWTDSIERGDLSRWQDFEFVPDKLLETPPAGATIVRQSEIADVSLSKWELSNNVTVYIKKSAGRKGHIQLTGFRRGGISALDSIDYINALFSKDILAASGAGRFTRQALTTYLTGNTASASLVLSKYREGVAASASIRDMETMFQLLYLKWTAPRVDRNAFDIQKRNAIENAGKSDYNVRSKYNKLISEKLAGEGEPEDITVERLETELTYDGIVPVFNKRFKSADGFDFVVIGDFDVDSIKPYLLTYLGGLPSTESTSQEHSKTLSSGEDAVILMKEGSTNKAIVNIFYQNADIVYDYPDIIKYELLSEVLKIKLRQNLREKNSGVYSINVSVSATSIPSTLFRTRVSFSCAPERYAFLTDQLNEEIKKIADNPAYFEKETANIKKQQLLTYSKQKDKETFWSSELRNHIYYGFKDWSRFTSYEQMLHNISSKDISEMVNKLLINGTKIQAVLLPENTSTHENK